MSRLMINADTGPAAPAARETRSGAANGYVAASDSRSPAAIGDSEDMTTVTIVLLS